MSRRRAGQGLGHLAEDAAERAVYVVSVAAELAEYRPDIVLIEGPPEGKEHRTPERYFGDVLEGSRLVATECSQDIIFE